MYVIGRLYIYSGKELYTACVNVNGKAWCCTLKAPYTAFKDKEEVKKVLANSKLEWPDAKFKVFDLDRWEVDTSFMNHYTILSKEEIKLKKKSNIPETVKTGEDTGIWNEDDDLWITEAKTEKVGVEKVGVGKRVDQKSLTKDVPF